MTDAHVEHGDAGVAAEASSERRRSSSGRRRKSPAAQAVEAVTGISVSQLRRRFIRHAVGLIVCQSAVAAGLYYLYPHALGAHLPALTAPLWACLPLAIVAESMLRNAPPRVFALVPIVVVLPLTCLFTLSVTQGEVVDLKLGGWLTLMFLLYWLPLVAVRHRQKPPAKPAARKTAKGWFCCNGCWRPMVWDTEPRPERYPARLFLLRPAICHTCHKRRLVPFFWKHRAH